MRRTLAAAALTLSLLTASFAHADAAPRERRFEFTYSTTVTDVPKDAKRVELWLPIPHDDEFQSIRALKVDAPVKYELTTGEHGNRMLHLAASAYAAKLPVTVHFEAKRREHVQARLNQKPDPALKPDADLARWLKPDRLVPLDDKIRGWAKDVVEKAGAKTDLEKARAIYNHVVATVKYDKSGTGWGRGDIYFACDARRGNCTDFHAMFIGYARAVGIPARFAIGFPLPAGRGEGKVAGYHCWAEFWANGIGWVPVDASEAAKNPDRREYFFGAHDENRVEMSRGRDVVLTPKQQGEPLNFFVYPYVEVDGKPYEKVEKTFAWKDLAPIIFDDAPVEWHAPVDERP